MDLEQLSLLENNILNIINNAVLVVDSEGNILYANSKAAAMFGCGQPDLGTCCFADLFPPEDQEILAPNILTLTRRKQEFSSEAMLARKDGTTFLGLVAASLVPWAEKNNIVVTIHDISKMKEIERVLHKNERASFLGRMLEDINHQIRNPVAVIGGLARRLQKVGAADATHTGAILSESNRLEALLDALHDFIVIPAPKFQIIDVSELLGILQPLVNRVAGRYDCTVRWQIADSLLAETLSCDSILLGRAVEAVAVNACEATKAADCREDVVVVLDRYPESAHPFVIDVIDYGQGVANQDMPNIFSPFFTRKTRQLGMGLTVANRIVTEQGGQLEVDTCPGRTQVTMHLVKERRRAIRTQKM